MLAEVSRLQTKRTLGIIKALVHRASLLLVVVVLNIYYISLKLFILYVYKLVVLLSLSIVIV